MKTSGYLCLLLACLAFIPGDAMAWDSMGHMIIDEIAYENVRPEVRLRVTELARILDSKYNSHKPYNFITAGCYMDDMRAAKDYPYSAWHFVDVPYTPNGMGYSEMTEPNVLWAFRQSVWIIRNAQATAAQKSEALAMIMHFAGDIHQPLHCVDWNDKGGNGYLITGIAFNDFSKKKIPTLHVFWDRAYRYDVKRGKPVELYYNLWPSERPDAPAKGIIKNQAAKIMGRYPLASLMDLVKVDDPDFWARESYRLGCRFGYPRRPHPEDYEVVTLTPWFVGQAHEIACRRIVLAGYRLANLLDILFASLGKQD